MKGLGDMMKQAQEMQANMKKAQDELADIEVIGQSGGGMVEVTITCRHDVKRVKLDPEIVGDDIEVLEDLIAAAVNDGMQKVEATTKEKMGSLTAGLNIPGLNLPF